MSAIFCASPSAFSSAACSISCSCGLGTSYSSSMISSYSDSRSNVRALATPDRMEIIAYNLERTPVHATLTAWGVDPGKWEVVQGVDTTVKDLSELAVGTL